MLIDDVAGIFGLQVKRAAPPRPPNLYSDTGWGTFDTMAEDWSLRKLQRQSMQCSWVYSNINLIARKVGAGKFNVVDDDDEQVESHEFVSLMRRPNELMSGRFLLQHAAMWLNLAGNAYWWLSPNFRGELVEIWPLPARDVTPVMAKSTSGEVLAGYEYTPMKDKLIPPETICHFRLANPFDILKGLEPISALKHEVIGDRAMKAWNVNFFDKKNAMPTTVFSLPQHTNADDFNRIRNSIYREFGGTKRRAMVTRAGDIKVESVGLSQRDMDFLAGIGLNRETIDRVFGIPAGYWAKDASRNVSATAELIVMRDTVQPTLDYFAEEIDAQIIDRYYDPALRVEAINLVPEDRQLNIAEFEAHAPVLTVGEARARAGMPLLGDERDEMLVPELTAMMRGPAFPTMQSNSDETTRPAMRADLLNWRKVAMREVAKGRDPGSREFVSDTIPARIKTIIEGSLVGVTDTDTVDGAFQPWLDGRGYDWIGYP